MSFYSFSTNLPSQMFDDPGDIIPVPNSFTTPLSAVLGLVPLRSPTDPGYTTHPLLSFSQAYDVSLIGDAFPDTSEPISTPSIILDDAWNQRPDTRVPYAPLENSFAFKPYPGGFDSLAADGRYEIRCTQLLNNKTKNAPSSFYCLRTEYNRSHTSCPTRVHQSFLGGPPPGHMGGLSLAPICAPSHLPEYNQCHEAQRHAYNLNQHSDALDPSAVSYPFIPVPRAMYTNSGNGSFGSLGHLNEGLDRALIFPQNDLIPSLIAAGAFIPPDSPPQSPALRDDRQKDTPRPRLHYKDIPERLRPVLKVIQADPSAMGPVDISMCRHDNKTKKRLRHWETCDYNTAQSKILCKSCRKMFKYHVDNAVRHVKDCVQRKQRSCRGSTALK